MASEDGKARNDRSSVCLRCKARKKKCDKGLPSCGRCTRLGLKCGYVTAFKDQRDSMELAHAIQTPPHGDGTSSVASRSTLSVPFLTEIKSRNTFVASSPVPEPSDHLSQEDPCNHNFDEQYTKQAFDIIARNGDNFETAAFEYTSSSYDWFPIIDRFALITSFMGLKQTPNAESANLMLCVYLMSTKSGQTKHQDIDHEQLYHTVKGLNSLLLSTGRASIEVVQGGLLIALFELGLGLCDAAYSSVGACARMGYLLGFDQTLSPDELMLKRSHTVVENERRVWWGTIILDR
jgi:hypothetical protein